MANVPAIDAPLEVDPALDTTPGAEFKLLGQPLSFFAHAPQSNELTVFCLFVQRR